VGDVRQLLEHCRYKYEVDWVWIVGVTIRSTDTVRWGLYRSILRDRRGCGYWRMEDTIEMRQEDE
jgi:hypothetical protein